MSIKDTEQNVDNINSALEQVEDKFENILEKNLSLDRVMTKLFETMTNLPKTIKNSGDLMKEMQKSVKLQQAATKQINEIVGNQLHKSYKEVGKIVDKQLSSIKNIYVKSEAQSKIEKQLLEMQQKKFGLVQRQLIANKLQGDSTDGFFKRAIASAKGLENSGGAFGKYLAGAAGSMEKLSMMSLGGFMTALVGGAIMLAFKALLLIIDLVTSAFMAQYNFLNDKVMPTVSKVNKAFGNMGGILKGIKSQAVGTGSAFERMGLGFETGAQAVIEFGAALMDPAPSKAMVKFGVMATQYVGATAESAAQLVFGFRNVGMGVTELNKTMNDATDVSKEYGVSVNQIRKDMFDNINVLQRFGVRNRNTFMRASAEARTYGLTIKDVDAAFGKNLSSFDAASKAASELNSAFGTQVNSYQLMLETDPTKRLGMLRKELVAQGKTWDNLNEFQKNFITSSLKVDENQAALILGSDKSRKSIEKDMRAKERAAKIDKDWDKGISNLKANLMNFPKLMQDLLRSVSNFIAKLFGFDNSTKPITKFTSSLESAINKISQGLDEVDPGTLVNLKDTFNSVMDTMKEIPSIIGDVKGVVSAIKEAAEVMGKIWKVGKFVTNPLGAGMDVAEDFVKSGDKSNAKDSIWSSRDLNKKPEASVAPVVKNYSAGKYGETKVQSTSNIDVKDKFSQWDAKKIQETININVNVDGRKVGSALINRAAR
jgi:hypothetical protein